MVDITPETQLTRKDRIATVIAVTVSIVAHLFVFFGGLQIYRWAEEEKQKERLMVIRRVRDSSPEAPKPSGRATPRRQSPPEAKVKEKGPEPPEDSGVTESTASDLPEEDTGPEEVEEEEEEEKKENTVSVVTDLSSATFTIVGAEEYHGAGTFWRRKGVPAGSYSATFHPVEGYRTPPIRRKELAKGGQIVFVGKYTKSIEVVVKVNTVPGASFEIIRPDGKLLDMTTPGRTFFEDLPPGNYTIRFADVDGYITPAGQTRGLGTGSGLNFSGAYLPAGRPKPRREEPPARVDTGLDRRVQLVVKSYPPTPIEEAFPFISYPEVIIKRSNFQKGWCQVYLILNIGSDGAIKKITVNRPSPRERDAFSLLIGEVERSVRSWDYDKVTAEVHVDARFYVE